MQHGFAQAQEHVALVTARAASRGDAAQSGLPRVMDGVLDHVATPTAARAGQGFHPWLHGSRGEYLQGTAWARSGQACVRASLCRELCPIAFVHAPHHPQDHEQRRADGREPQGDGDRGHVPAA